MTTDDRTTVNGQTLYVPEARTFSDLFTRVERYGKHTIPRTPIEGIDYSKRGRMGRMFVGPYCYIRDGLSLAVEPTEAVMRVAREMLMVDGDHLSFEIIRWDDGRALVVLKYGQIIGSRWLAMIDAGSIPWMPGERRVIQVATYGGVGPRFRVAECVGMHQGEPMTITWSGLHETREAAAASMRNVKGYEGRDAEIRYVVTHVGADGMRQLSHAMQGRDTYATPEEAQAWIDAARVNNSADTLRQVYGERGAETFAVRPVPCYPGHLDPMTRYFDDAAPRFVRVSGDPPVTVTCKACGVRLDTAQTVAWADTQGEAFAAYYCEADRAALQEG